VSRGAARVSMRGAGSAVVAAALLASLCLPPVAFAASVEASPVVTVEGSVSSVDGTVSVRPVTLTTATVNALASAVASVTPATDPASAEWADLRLVVWAAACVGSFWLSLLAGYQLGRL